ncbi:hypothetical protein P5G65_04830 [Paenibacillus chondroitinus]|uniref:Uncharacterized protein n=1 Tax=Paenibacillus chondroitinus TaxID=59842 RepID=A0ABU6D664_9BACL|nr:MULTISPECIES: hypothetical protein [Paenibacillus]MCY9658128.1 hypothetical protein [Paenibacillus anseongense]MEB4793210.1 hypothetical protein [Paenibacillus chondroitinus]
MAKEREREHGIRPDRMDKFVGSPKGLRLEFSDGRKGIVVETEKGKFTIEYKK